jgi:hypothetical protein
MPGPVPNSLSRKVGWNSTSLRNPPAKQRVIILLEELGSVE